MNKLLDRILDEYGLIACGWSGDWDLALRSALKRAPNRRYPFYWACRGPLSRVGEDLLNLRRGNVVPITDADNFFGTLQRRVETLIATRRPNVQSVELLIGSAKRYLSRSEYRIQLADLLKEEYSTLIRKLSDASFDLGQQWSVDNFRRRVTGYEAAVEPLARLFAVMGRWGDGGEFSLVREIIGAESRHESVSGTVVWLHMRRYPAVLLLYAYGLGLINAKRYDVLFRLFSHLVRDNRMNFVPLVGQIMLGAWEGGDNKIWQNLEGLDRRKVPLSDHLFEVTSKWKKEYLISEKDFEIDFAFFELLRALSYISANNNKEDLDLTLSNRGTRNFVWAPVGRLVWDTDGRAVVFSLLETTEIKKNILAAGFAGGDEAFLSQSIESFRRLLDEMRWI